MFFTYCLYVIIISSHQKKGDDTIKTVLTALNAKYIHTNLALRSIASYAEGNLTILEYTINQPLRYILEKLYFERADIYMFSCYIWNIGLIVQLIAQLKLLLPGTVIVLGGPQVSFHSEDVLRENPAADIIVVSEGERTVGELLALLEADSPLDGCRGLVFRRSDGMVRTPRRPPIDLDTLSFAYNDLERLDGRIVYYESMRGCPFSCSYCLSSTESVVRLRGLPLVFDDLRRFLDSRIRQVKFVDRTFNCNKAHAIGIWQWLIENDNGVTNFHFELAGGLLDDSMLEILATARPGLFQFEIGVQSTNTRTLAAINRLSDTGLLFKTVERLRAAGNIHLHLDLIAGLPYEDIGSFGESFNRVYAALPHQLQVGFLKVLPGSDMERDAARYGIVYPKSAPFEVLSTGSLDFTDLCELRGVAEMVDIYYNSGRFSHTISHIIASFDSPFEFYRLLWKRFSVSTEGAPVSKTGYYDILADFAVSNGVPLTHSLKWYAKYDLLLHEKPKKLPSWVDVGLSREYRGYIRGFFADKNNILKYLPSYAGLEPLQIERLAHLEIFPFNPVNEDPGEIAVLFDYQRRGITGQAATWIFDLTN